MQGPSLIIMEDSYTYTYVYRTPYPWNGWYIIDDSFFYQLMGGPTI